MLALDRFPYMNNPLGQEVLLLTYIYFSGIELDGMTLPLLQSK